MQVHNCSVELVGTSLFIFFSGPSVGGALYQLGGFTLPFATLGGILVAVACLTIFVLPAHDGDQQLGASLSVQQALYIPSVAIAAFSILCASSSIGFLVASLEPHMRQFELSPLLMGPEEPTPLSSPMRLA